MKFFLLVLAAFCVINTSVYATSFRLIDPNSPKMSPGFSQLGDAYQHKNLIWSYSGPLLSFGEAKKFCESINARLPTIDEWKQLFSAPAPDNLLHFNDTFWSSTEKGPSFNSLSIKTFHDYGIPYETKSDSDVKNAVRCVIELSLDDLKSQLKELGE